MRKNLYLQGYFYVDTVKNCPKNRIELFCLPYWGLIIKKVWVFMPILLNLIKKIQPIF